LTFKTVAERSEGNWSVVRRLVGYDRYSSRAALEQLSRVYGLVRLYGNFFQPVMKLKHKSRQGAKVRKVYDEARTPYRRLLESSVLPPERGEALGQLYRSLNPARLLARSTRSWSGSGPSQTIPRERRLR